MLAISAILRVQPGKEEEFIQAFKAFLPHVKAEPGTDTYRLHRSLDEPTKFLIYERYKSRDDINAHGSSAEFKAFSKGLAPFMAGKAEISMFEEIE